MKHQTISIVNHTPQFPVEKEAFGLFSERILELCNHTFSRMYRRVFHKYWNNSVFSRVKRNYCFTDWNEGIYEVYMPTQENMDFNMQYYRIIVKVIPEMDSKIIEKELVAVERARVKPMGINDSELIVFVAPHRSREAATNRQFFTGFRHIRKRGYFTTLIITPWSEQAFKRILTLIANFLDKRITAFRKKIKLFLHEYMENNELYYKYNRVSYSPSIVNTLRCLSHSLDWVSKRLLDVYREIGRQNMINTCVKPVLKRVKEVLQPFTHTPTYIRNGNIRDPPILKKLLMVFQGETARLKAG